MKIGHTIDSNGFLTGDILSDSGIAPDVVVICPDGFYRPKWNGSSWVEGMTQTEIDGIANAPTTPTAEDRLKALEDARLADMLGL